MQPHLFSIPVRYFLEVAEAGSVHQASKRLYVAASAVSRQIGKLEASLGMALFERAASGMVLTAAGHGLLAHVRAGHVEAGRVVQQLQGLAAQARLRLRLACTEGFSSGLMPGVVADFRALHPQAEIEWWVLSPAEGVRHLQQGEADIGLQYSLAPEPGLEVLHAARAPVVALMRPAHPLAAQTRVAVADVVRYPLALGPPGMTARRLFDLRCNVLGLRYRTAMVSNVSAALMADVRGEDIVLAGTLTAAPLLRAGVLVARPFSDVQMRQRMLQVVGAVGRRGSGLEGVFVEHVVAALREAVGAGGVAPSTPARKRR